MENKIIFTGQVGAGKTSAINAISDIDIVATEAKASDDVALKKMQTTVAMDYGTLKLENNTRVHLVGTPGQERFRFMWDILIEGGLGLVILIDNSSANPVDEMEFYLKAFENFIRRNAVAIGITRMDMQSSPTLDDYQARLDQLEIVAPLLEVDARAPQDIKVLVQNLLVMLSVRTDTKHHESAY